MASRPRRGRGRPPKTPLSGRSTPKSSFLLKKPRYYEQQGAVSSEPSSRSSTPVGSSPITPTYRGTGRGSRNTSLKSRNYIKQLILESDTVDASTYYDCDRSSDVTDMDLDNSNYPDSDDTYDESESIYSEESFSTVSSFSKKRFFSRNLKALEFEPDKDIPPLILPTSSTDLMIGNENLMQAVGIYEVLRHFRMNIRLSPFTFEDFLAALLSDEQCSMLSEINISIMKALLREEDSSNTTFGPHDLKDSINVLMYFMDGMTWPELVRAYLDSDHHTEFRSALPSVELSDFPFVPIEEKLKVMQALTDLFLATNAVREEIMNEGNIHYDDHCRSCHRFV